MPISPDQWTVLQLLEYFLPKICFAIICGGVLGLERELKNKPAGIKTNILICLGSMLYSAVSLLSSIAFASTGHYGDPSRVTAQIVSGIGFLGAGAIIQARGTIVGLTTAATIWVVAAIGIAIGLGHADIAIITTITVILILVGTNWFEDRVLGRSLSFACEIVAEDSTGQVRFSIHQALAQNNLSLDDFDLITRDGLNVLTCRYRGHRTDQKKFILDLWSTPGIREVKQL